jgi:hypothetical protein
MSISLASCGGSPEKIVASPLPQSSTDDECEAVEGIGRLTTGRAASEEAEKGRIKASTFSRVGTLKRTAKARAWKRAALTRFMVAAAYSWRIDRGKDWIQ